MARDQQGTIRFLVGGNLKKFYMTYMMEKAELDII